MQRICIPRAHLFVWLLTVMAASTPASSFADTLPTGTYTLISQLDNQVVDVLQGQSANGTPIVQEPWDKTPHQIWSLTTADADSYFLINVATSKCLDVENISHDSGAHIHLWDCINGPNQRWVLQATGDGTYSLVSVNSGDCLDVTWAATTPGTQLQQYTCNGTPAQHWTLKPQGSTPSTPTPAPTPTPTPTPAPTPTPTPTQPPSGGQSFGTMVLHPDRISFYMVPDLDSAYTQQGGSPAGWCPWTTTQASLIKMHQLLPNAWIRWDNETGHNSDDTGSVETFVSCANNAKVPMTITASAVDGYNNWWANGNQTPNTSMVDVANGPYLQFAWQLAQRYASVKYIETVNEPDGPWFFNDGDNVSDFNYYIQKLTSVTGDMSRILGPCVASRDSQIWNSFVSRSDAKLISYHTYGGASDLSDVGGKQVYVTEYGGFELTPAAVLADLWVAESTNKLSGTIQKLFYQQITDNGGNRGAFNHDAMENGHFALRDWFRALTLYQAASNVSTHAATDPAHNDFVATDDGGGNTALLYWNNSGATVQSDQRSVTGTSLQAGAKLYVALVSLGDADTAQCQPLASQNWVGVRTSGGTTTLQLNAVAASAAVLVSTQPCDNLAN